MKRLFSPLLYAVVALSLVTGGWIATQVADDDLFELKKNFEIFGAVYEELVVNYVDDIRPGPFMRAGVDAMLTRLDPYTQYYDQAYNVDLDQMRRGSVGDVGLNIGQRDGRITVLPPESDAAGYLRGVQTGDVIRKVDGVDIADWSVLDVVGVLRGDEGTTVEIEIERKGESLPLTYTLVRSVTQTDNVAYSGYLGNDPGEGVGYVRLNVFGNRAAREVRRALRDMAREGGLTSIVLDLRNNPGGILSEAIEMVGLFVPQGTTVVSTRGRIDDITQSYQTKEDPFFADVPVIVLVNDISASASEIVAGALQDLDRGVIIGETTYGKGLIQVMRSLPHNTSMKITIGHYYTPSGRDIQSRRISSTAAEVTAPDVQEFRTAGGRSVRSGVGVEPDFLIQDKPMSELEAALSRQGMFFRYAGEVAATNPNASVDDLILDDSRLIPAFKRWLGEVNFEYASRAQVLLDSLSRDLEELEYASAENALDAVRSATLAEKLKDFDRHGSLIADQLRREILARYLTEPERIQRSLATDVVALEALALSRDPDRYGQLLGK